MSKSKGDEAAARFESWAASQSLSYFREITNRNRTQLVRTAIMAAVGIDRPALRQNTQIQQALESLETRLREEGVLVGKPVDVPNVTGSSLSTLPLRPPASPSSFIDAERLSRLEHALTAKDAELAQLRPLRAENEKLKRMVRELQDQLTRFQSLHDVLCESGRLPR